MAEPRRARRRSLVRLVGDVVDDSKGLVDDALDRAGSVERDLGRSLRSAVADGEDTDGELLSLRSELDDLAAKVERLAKAQGLDGSAPG